MNDQEREMWVMNDEELYHWWRSERCGVSTFIRAHRVILDRAINRALGCKPSDLELRIPTWR